MTKLEAVADAMRAKRAELIAKPLDRVWPELARAAVEAMREPTHRMAKKGGNSQTVNSIANRTLAFRNMIDAALAEEQPK